VARRLESLLARGQAAASSGASRALAAGDALLRRLLGPGGPVARTWATGTMAIGVMALLLALLLSYYAA
jgi:hypothetical protein